MLSSSNLHAALHQVGITQPGDIFEQLTQAYAQPWRHYHNQTHLEDCLTKLSWFQSLCKIGASDVEVCPNTMQFAEIEIALYFHDAVYHPRHLDNEEKSARWAQDYLSSNEGAAQSITHIVELILATKTHQAVNAITALLLDIDLSILGAPSHQFAIYNHAIYREYHWIPDCQYRLSRIQILNRFLQRKSIYQTQLFQEHYESQARINLAQQIQALQSQS